MECPICFENVQARSERKLPCAHAFHKKCISNWLKTAHTCPMCRAPAAEAAVSMATVLGRFIRLLGEYAAASDAGEKEYKKELLVRLYRQHHLEYDARVTTALSTYGVTM